MDVITALQTRKSVRAFLPRPVERETIQTILDAARHAPSGANTQPWQVAVVTGDAKQKLQTSLEAAFREGKDSRMDYIYYPQQWGEPYLQRRRACGAQLYDAVGITREDKQRRLDQWAANYRGFDAPVLLLFFLDHDLQAGSYLDSGMFWQSVMLTAVELGLATCPQAALGEYPDIVKQQLGYASELTLLGGMALGYEDTAAAINQYRTPRDPVEAFTRFFD